MERAKEAANRKASEEFEKNRDEEWEQYLKAKEAQLNMEEAS